MEQICVKMAQRTGRLPQNVNFAISEGTARAFLDANNVPYEVEQSDKPLPTADIAAKARDFTAPKTCNINRPLGVPVSMFWSRMCR